jgi:hypothetical protein
MTIRLLAAYANYPINAIVSLNVLTETNLITAKQATLDLTGGASYAPPLATVRRHPAMLEVDSSSNIAGLVGPNGVMSLAEIGAPGSDVLASKAFPHHFRVTRKALNTATAPAFTTTPTAATEIYVDFNRGADANPGTRALPKKNLSALSTTTIGAGSVVALASDSVWTLLGSQASSGAITADNWMGNQANPLLITAYDPAGHTGTKPTISMGHAPAASEWTWDATMSAWLWQPTNAALHPDAGMAVFFGPARLHGIDVFQDANGKAQASLPPLFGDLQFAHKTDFASSNKVWVWAPSTQNPTDYYGGIWLTMTARGVFSTGFMGLSNTIIDGLKFKDTGVGIYVAIGSNSGANIHTGLVVKNCEAERSSLLLMSSSEVAAHSVTVNNNKGNDLPATLVKVSGVGTLAYNVHSNEVKGCNRQCSTMAAFYMQTAAANLGDAKLHHNYVADAWNGVGAELNTNGRSGFGAPFDGTAYYFDLGSSKSVAYANISERCHVAIQTNSAKTVQVIGHIALDCNVLSTSTDAGSAGSNDVTIAHCTYINRLPDLNQLKRGTSSSPKIGISNWFETLTGNTIRVFNNALYRTVPVTDFEAIRVANEAGTKFVAGNAVSGWTQGVKALSRAIDGSVSTDITSTAITVSGSGDAWFEPGSAVPTSASPLTKAGVRYIDGLMDATGVSYGRIPSIGAVVYTG